MKKIDQCPKCGGVTGYTFTMLERNLYEGNWGTEGEQSDNVWVKAPRTASCIDCNARINIDVAEGVEN